MNKFISKGFISAPYLNYNGFLIQHSTLPFERRSYSFGSHDFFFSVAMKLMFK